MFKPKGIIVAMLTPMNADETINEKELRNQVNRFVDRGIHGLFCLGTNGEFYGLNYEEKIRIMEIVLDENKDRLPIYAGTGCTTTKETIALTQKAKDLGAHAVSIVCPYYAASNQKALYNHFKDIAEAVDIPIILYNIPGRTGINMDADTVGKLSKIENIVAVKDSSGNFDNILKYIEVTDDDFSVLSGNDSLILWNLLAGGKGGIAGCANIVPNELVAIYERFIQGDIEGAKKAQSSIRPIREVFKMGNPNSIIKRATELMGYDVGPCRAPFNIDNPELDAALKAVLSKFEKQ
ncbi:MAG: 4-hydroxy-tetrahydrodipicolinate synthase [Clostridia bacterium]